MNNLTGHGYTITAQQFVEQGYEQKIGSGECKVYYYTPPPDDNDTDNNKWAYQYMLEKYGNVIEIQRIENVDNSGFYLADGGLGMRAGTQLWVSDPNTWKTQR